jgi:hypothetical protein
MNCWASFGSTRDGSRGGNCRNAEEALMAIVAGFDVHRSQITFDALDTETGEVSRGRIDVTPAAVSAWVRRFEGAVKVAVEACTGWLFVCDALVVSAHPGDAVSPRHQRIPGEAAHA